MATTRESIDDALRWLWKMFRIGGRRAVVVGVLAGLFALAVIVATRETVSDCGDVTDDQRARLASLREPEPGRSFRTARDAACTDGEFSAPIEGVADGMEAATDQLEGDGWALDTDYIAFHRQVWRYCFRLDEPGWEQVQITVDATRDGAVHTVTATAVEGADACDAERRDESEIYPPRR